MSRKYVKVDQVSEEMAGEKSKYRANRLTKNQQVIIDTCNEVVQSVLNKFKQAQ